MKNKFILFAVFLLVTGIAWFKLNRVVKHHVDELRSRQMHTNQPKEIPKNMQGVTNDPLVVEFFENHRKTEVGKVVNVTNDRQQFWVDDRLIFEAKRIGDRSKANDGTIAIDAVTGVNTPIECAEMVESGEESRLISSAREILIIQLNGDKINVSPTNVDAFAPMIEPNTKLIAFTGRVIDEKGFPSEQQLYVGDPMNGQYKVFVSDEHLHHYQIWAVDWINNGSILIALEDHGETGGNMKIKKIQIKSLPSHRLGAARPGP